MASFKKNIHNFLKLSKISQVSYSFLMKSFKKIFEISSITFFFGGSTEKRYTVSTMFFFFLLVLLSLSEKEK